MQLNALNWNKACQLLAKASPTEQNGNEHVSFPCISAASFRLPISIAIFVTSRRDLRCTLCCSSNNFILNQSFTVPNCKICSLMYFLSGSRHILSFQLSFRFNLELSQCSSSLAKDLRSVSEAAVLSPESRRTSERNKRSWKS